MKLRTFTEFMQERHGNIFPMLLDDDLPDHFNDWIGNLQVDDLIDYADFYGREQLIVGNEMALNKFTSNV